MRNSYTMRGVDLSIGDHIEEVYPYSLSPFETHQPRKAEEFVGERMDLWKERGPTEWEDRWDQIYLREGVYVRREQARMSDSDQADTLVLTELLGEAYSSVRKTA